MKHYVGLDVSLKLTAICIVDRTGKIEREGVVTSDTDTIAAFVKSHDPTATWGKPQLSQQPRVLPGRCSLGNSPNIN